MDLVTSMLHYHPQHRPMIADIIGHPWLAGPTATEDQIKAEFQNRLQIVNERVKEEQQQEKAVKDRNRRSEVIKGVRYVWGELTELDKNDTEHEVIQLKMNEFRPATKKTTCFFSDTYPDLIFKKIATALDEGSVNYNIHHKQWKLVYNVEKKLMPKELPPIEGMKELGIEEEKLDLSKIQPVIEYS